MKSLLNGFLGAILRELLIMEECLTRLCSISPHNFVFLILLLLHGCISQSLPLRKFQGVLGNRHSKFGNVVCEFEAKGSPGEFFLSIESHLYRQGAFL